jgi:hypothetical protein
MRKETTDRIRVRFEQELSKLSDSSASTIDEIEDLALRLRARAGEIAAEELARETGEAEDASRQKTECACGRWARFKGMHARDVVMMAGTARFERRYYYCRRCDSGFCPADALMGCVGTSFSLRVRQETARLACLASSYQLGVGLLYDLGGVSVSESQAQRMALEAGSVAEALFDERREAALSGQSQSAARPAVLYLEGDGVHTPIVGGYKETKVGVALAVDSLGERISTGYTSLLGGCEEFGEHWFGLACRHGLSGAQTVVVLGDGAKWLWSQADMHFPTAVQILDIWHAMEHLGELARAAFGEGVAAGGEWLAERLDQLRSSRLVNVMASVRALAEDRPSLAAAVREALEYLANNRSRMDYATYLRMGLKIGSGAVEATCKRMVSLRLKGPGMRWKAQTAQAITRLRCLFFGEEWKLFTKRWQAA